MSAQQRYKGLDGLKGLAILFIILYHLNTPGFSGGFIGVDIFFAISGYLTATSLRRRLKPDTGRGRATGEFYRSRLRRLWPSILTVTATTICLAWILCRQALTAATSQIIGALTFTYNWVDIARGASYFAGLTPEPLKHMWYVAILGQFLLIAPLLTLLAQKTPKKTAWIVPTIFTLLALASSVEMGILFRTGADPTRVYFGTDTHAYALLAGMALGWADTLPRYNTARQSSHWTRISPWAGLAALLTLTAAAILVRQNAFAFRGGLAGVCTLTLILILALTGENTWLTRILSWQPLTFLGRHSYGLYLWHYPLFVLISARWAATSTLPAILRALLTLTLTALLAWLTHTFIDTPIAENGPVHPYFSLDAWKTTGGIVRCATSITVITALVMASITALWSAPAMSQTQAALEADSVFLEHNKALAASQKTNDTSEESEEENDGALASAFAAQVEADTALSDKAIDAMRQEAEAQSDETQKQAQLQAAQAAEDARDAAVEKVKKQAEAEQKLAAQKNLPTSDAMPDGGEITMIGDSVMLGASPSILTKFPGAYIDAAVSRHFASVYDIVNQARDAGNLRKWVVVGLGTNGTVTSDDLATLDQTLGEGHVIVLVTAYADRSWIAPSNQAVTEYAAAHADHVLVDDWATAIGLQPDLLYADGFHPTEPEGGDLYAQTLYNAINAWVTEQAGETKTKQVQ